MTQHPQNPDARNPAFRDAAFSNPDARIDQILNALRSTEPPVGLEARIAARLAARRLAFNAGTAQESTPFFAVILNAMKDPRIPFADARLYASAATTLTLLLTLSTLTIHHRLSTRPSSVILSGASERAKRVEGAQSKNPEGAQSKNPDGARPTTNQVPQGFSLGSHSPTLTAGVLTPAQQNPDTHASASAYASASTQVPQGFSLGSHSPTLIAGVSTPAQQDPDTIALAETLAPSRPAPPMPLTTQEAALVRATREGQPIELAELSILRDANLRSLTEAREHANLHQYIQALLAPLAVAQAFDSTPSSPSPDATQPATPSESTTPPQSK